MKSLVLSAFSVVVMTVMGSAAFAVPNPGKVITVKACSGEQRWTYAQTAFNSALKEKAVIECKKYRQFVTDPTPFGPASTKMKWHRSAEFGRVVINGEICGKRDFICVNHGQY